MTNQANPPAMSLITLKSCAKAPEDTMPRLPVFSWSENGLTVSLTVFGLLVGIVPQANDWLQFDRSALEAGQWWRAFTGHFTHWNGEHLAWDLLTFFGLGILCESTDRRKFVAVLLASSLFISLAMWVFMPTLRTYRGLSGLDTAFFSLLAVSMLKITWCENNGAVSQSSRRCYSA